MVTPPFNPCQQKYGIVPGASNRPTLWGSESGASTTGLGQAIGYLRAILRYETGHTGIIVACVPATYTYTQACVDGIRDVQAFFGLPVTGVVDQATWNALDVCYWF